MISKTYSSYKNTGITGLEIIPSEWSISKVKYCFFRKNEKANQENPIILSLARDGVKIRDITTGEGQIAESYYHYNPVKPGDLLLNPMDLVSGANCSLSEVEGVISPAYINLKAKTGINPKYYDYFFKLQYWSMAFFSLGQGVSFKNRWTISNETIMNYLIPLPEKNTQDKIVNFLDNKLYKIDKVIEDDKKFIKLLEEKKISLIHHSVTTGLDAHVEMKETSIPWANSIPDHWNICRGKNILIQLKRHVKPNDEVITCFRDGEVTLRSKRRESGFTISDKEIGYQGVEKNDLVVHGMDGFAGAIGISKYRGKGSPVLIVLNSNQNKKYLMYYLRNLAYNNVFLSLSTGIRVRSCDLRWEKLADLLYLIPPLDEQKQIANFLDNNIELINKIIEKIQNHIELLEKYKISLIHNVVTGKVDVRDEV